MAAAQICFCGHTSSYHLTKRQIENRIILKQWIGPCQGDQCDCKLFKLKKIVEAVSNLHYVGPKE